MPRLYKMIVSLGNWNTVSVSTTPVTRSRLIVPVLAPIAKCAAIVVSEKRSVIQPEPLSTVSTARLSGSIRTEKTYGASSGDGAIERVVQANANSSADASAGSPEIRNAAAARRVMAFVAVMKIAPHATYIYRAFAASRRRRTTAFLRSPAVDSFGFE